MALLLLACVVMAASAAPPINEGVYGDWQKEMLDRMDFNKLQELYPAKRSNYGSYYVSPCAAAASGAAYSPAATAPISAYAAAAATPYSYGHAAYHPAPAHHGYPSHYGHPYYRSMEELENEQESMGFSDMNHVGVEHAPMARYSYGAAPGAPAGGSYEQAAASGPVVGVFSNAKVGGCSVPLLVSCSPSIAHGQIVKTHPYYDSSAYPSQQVNSYRGADEHAHGDEDEMHQEKGAHSASELLPHHSKTITEKHQ